MKISQQILNGEIKITEKELRFLAENHGDYDLTRLDVSKISNFSTLFLKQKTFNQDIGNWDVSFGKDFKSMFQGALSFNQNINLWDVSNGIEFDKMFYKAARFNKPVDRWDMRNANSIYKMFCNAKTFNQDIRRWNVENVKSVGGFVLGALCFKYNILNWKLASYQLDSIKKHNFYLSFVSGHQKIGIIKNAEQLHLVFKGSPKNPFPSDFLFEDDELYLIKTGSFYGVLTSDNMPYRMNRMKTSLYELSNVCEIEFFKNNKDIFKLMELERLEIEADQ